VSNFLTILVTAIAAVSAPINAALTSMKLSQPGNLILAIQFVMLAIYTPFVLKSVHRFQGLLMGLSVGFSLQALRFCSPPR
jgi:hypothetical protein